LANIDLFLNTYDTVFSLGSNCRLAKQLQINDVYNAKSPFDWIVCESTKNLTTQFKNNFIDFFLPVNLMIDKNQSEFSDTLYITDTSNGFRSLHDIRKNSIDDLYNEVYKKFQHKIKSFFTRIESGKKILFVRLLEDSDDYDAMHNLTESVNIMFPHKDINFLYIKHNNKELSIEIAHNIQLLCFETNYDGINNHIEWIGNNKNWKKAFSNLKVISRKDAYLSGIETLFDGRLNGRKIVVWGMQYLFADIERLLKQYGCDNYFAYDKELSKRYESSLRILQNTDFLDENKPYIIINTNGFFEEIFDSLSSKGFNYLTDYYFF